MTSKHERMTQLQIWHQFTLQSNIPISCPWLLRPKHFYTNCVCKTNKIIYCLFWPTNDFSKCSLIKSCNVELEVKKSNRNHFVWMNGGSWCSNTQQGFFECFVEQNKWKILMISIVISNSLFIHWQNIAFVFRTCYLKTIWRN